jgi:MFS family permease
MSAAPTSAPIPDEKLPWYRGLSKYHWFVLVVCWLAWFFDTMDQQLFVLSRTPAMKELVLTADGNVVASAMSFYNALYGVFQFLHLDATWPASPDSGAVVKLIAGMATMILMFGWATGGIVFGILGDRWGRAKTMITAILCYSVFTGLSALSVSWIDFSIYRFLMGLGVGGTFGAAVSFVAEVMPARSRPYALGFLQALAAVGNMTAACISFALPPATEVSGISGWRLLFTVGIIPALLAVLMMRRLKEPESWVRAKEAERRGEAQHKGKGMGSMRELFGDRRWRKNVLVGIVLGLAGIMGLWGIGFWLPELVRDVIPGVTPAEKANQDWYVSMAMLLFNGAAAIGTYAFAALMGWVGRRPAFALMFVLAIASVLGVFGFMTRADQVWWMAPLLGLGTLTIFGGYSIYFPELFPTRLRATGVGFCYNTARYVAATAPFTLGLLTTVYVDWHPTILSSLGSVDSGFRYAAFTVAGGFVAGLLVLPFAPETKDKPLPE